MAMIENIRKRKELLIIFIGIGMIGFLIPYDAVMALFQQGQNQSIGEINGKSISVERYAQERDLRKSLFNYSSAQNLDTDLWNQLIDESIMNDQYNEVGLVVSDAEFEEIMFGEIISPYVQSTFYQQGVTPEAKENQRLIFENMQEQNPGMYLGYKKIVSERRAKEKWVEIVENGIYVNTLDAKHDYIAKNESRSFNFVLKKYDEIGDSLISYDDSDIKAYFRKHKGDREYQQVQGRDIEYVEFVVDPSEADLSSIQTELNTLKEQWQDAEDDSLFCVANSTSGRYIKFDYRDGDFDGPENENIMNDEVGTIVGPYKQTQGTNSIQRLVKILDRENDKIDSVKVRHILIKGVGDEEIARAQEVVDSLKTELARGADFAELVEKHTEDPASIPNGGEYTFPRGQMDPAFETASFDGEIGQLTEATSSYGIHLIEVLDKMRNDVVTVAAIDRPEKASPATIKAGFTQASEFGINYNSIEDFQNAADTMGMTVLKASNITRNQPNVSNLRNAYDLVNWAYDAEVGEVSNAIQVDNKWIVAVLTGARET
ncbi:MAG: hypothetical protein HKN32_07800, partial [Flavobacteriales bacterium]|nr:hypothetical protein [Flavobacteriales bacterium]